MNQGWILAGAYRRLYVDVCINDGYEPHEAEWEADKFENEALEDAGFYDKSTGP